MKPVFILILAMAFGLASPPAVTQQILPAPLSPRITQYKIKAELDPVSQTVKGEIILDWRNPSRDTVHDLQFHMYLNAFKNARSAFKAQGRTAESGRNDYGFVDIDEIRTSQGEDLTNRLKFIQPDENLAPDKLTLPDEKPLAPDMYGKDQTVVSVPLINAVLPDSSIRVKIRFTSKLPKLSFRTGFSKDFFFVAQWFPKLGVYEPAGMRYAKKGGWNTHQFHPNSEFYSNHSLYQVDITLPQEYVVGSGGKLMNKQEADGKQTLSYRAEDIVDFAWTASKDYKVVEDQWKHVNIKLLIQPEHFYQAERHIKAAKFALEYLENHVGPYPWNHLTIIDPPSYGQGAGGMEYTTMITAGTFYMLPAQIRLPEMVTVHEFGHAYFMGILASNEFEEPWLDEGVNSYWENRIMDWAYGEKTSMFGFPFFHIGDVEFSRISWLGGYRPNLVATFNNSWNFPRNTYGSSVYQKPATMLNTLERMIGQETMDRIFKKYYDRWAFRHPSSHDFVRVVNEVVTESYGNRFGENLNWFFDQFLFGTASVDYAIRTIRVLPVIEKGGLFDKGGSKTFIKSEKVEGMYRSVIQLERLQDGIIPVEIAVRFDNGEQITERWDGKDKVYDLVYERPARVVSACIDPASKILLDANLLNNSYVAHPSSKPALKWTARFLFFVENLIHSMSLFA
ncbi:MAG: M1 family metallopeptidase [Bacteroidia bacterium]|nr:M1 family metallopeptidase [Bacteroidia bacterium]